MTAQPFENAAQQPDTTQPVPECPPASIAPQNGTQGRNEWADGYAAAKRFYGDSAPIALDQIRARLDQYTDTYGGRNSIVPGGVISDLYAILDTAQEPHA